MARPVDPEVHWAEGQFLLPHHFQAHNRHVASLVGSAALGGHPYGWGFRVLEIVDAEIGNGLVRIDRCAAVFPDGTIVQVPETAEVEAREFGKYLTGKESLEVRLGLRLYRDAAPNLDAGAGRGEPGRFLLRALERQDENTGENPQPIETRRLRLRIFLGDEDTSGYSTIPVTRLRRGGGIGALPERTEFVAPLLELGADPRLRALCADLGETLVTKDRVLGHRLSQRRITFVTAAGAEAEEILKLHTLNTEIPPLEEILRAPAVHPFEVFRALRRLAGALSIFDETRTPGDLPAYAHEDPAGCFAPLAGRIRALLAQVAPTWFVEAPFEVVQPGIHRVALKEEWLVPENEFWIGLFGAARATVAKDLGGNAAKIGSPAELEDIVMRVLVGIRARAVEHVPPDLPDADDRVYFSLETEGPYWGKARDERALAFWHRVSGKSKDGGVEVRLFVRKAR